MIRAVPLLLACTVASAESTAVRCDQRWIEPTPGWPRVVIINDGKHTGGGSGNWQVYDVSRIAPPGATWVRLEGRMIISRGRDSGRCEINVSVAPGNSRIDRKHGQSEAGDTVGQREPWSVAVPLREQDGMLLFSLRWTKRGQGASREYPAGCNFGLNLWAVEWCSAMP